MVNIVAVNGEIRGSDSIALNTPSQPGRALIVLARQSRNPTNLTSIAFDDVEPKSENLELVIMSGGARAVLYAVFENDDLPADAGTYELRAINNVTATRIWAIEVTGYESYESISGEDTSENSIANREFTFPTGSDESIMFLVYEQGNQNSSAIEIIDGTTYSIEDVPASQSYVIGSKPGSDSGNSIAVGGREGATQIWVGLNVLGGLSSSTPTIRKTGSQTFDKPEGIGTITGVTLNGQAITLDSQDAETFTVTDSDGSITTSGEYDLVATGDTVETITVQVNVYGVTPSNNPLQRDGVPLDDLTDVELRISAGTTLAGSELYYTGTATTDGSGDLATIDLSDTAADADDDVLLSIRTAAGDSIIAPETVELI